MVIKNIMYSTVLPRRFVWASSSYKFLKKSSLFSFPVRNPLRNSDFSLYF